MPNYNQAPVLQYDREKPQATNFYQIPQPVADKVFAELGNASAQLRIMLVLIGTKPGFAVSEKWILDRTGLQKASYITARKALIAKGWLTLVETENITVNFNVIMGEENAGPKAITNQKNSCGNTIYTQRGNMVYTDRGNMVYPIINNNTNNIINKDNPEAPRSKVEATKEVVKDSTNPDKSFKF